MSQIKNIIFDLGGVLLDVDYNKTADAFRRLGVTQFDELYSQANANRLFEELETGSIKEEAFYENIGQYCTPDTSRDQMMLAWNEILLDFRKSSLEYLKKLADKYQLFLFSNTNSIHLTAFNKILADQTGESSLDNYFIKSYYSHVIGKRKPYPETFEWILKDAGLNASETLFIDDSVKNVEGAKMAGIQTHLLMPGEKIEDLDLL
ncbi:MAG: HAD family phosphatase [Ferruginibacter sp.]